MGDPLIDGIMGLGSAILLPGVTAVNAAMSLIGTDNIQNAANTVGLGGVVSTYNNVLGGVGIPGFTPQSSGGAQKLKKYVTVSADKWNKMQKELQRLREAVTRGKMPQGAGDVMARINELEKLILTQLGR